MTVGSFTDLDSPNNAADGLLIPHQLHLRREPFVRLTVSFKKGVDQARISQELVVPGAIYVHGPVVPPGVFKVDDCGEVAILVGKPIAWCEISMNGAWHFTLKIREMLRRKTGPNDRRLKKLFKGARGLPFTPTEKL